MKKYKNIIFTCVVILSILFMDKVLLRNKDNVFTKATSYITKPIGSIFSGTGWWIHKKLSFFVEIGNLKQENQRLFDENLSLQSKLANSNEIAKENEILRQELKLAPREKYQLEPAMVIGRESGNYSEIIYLDKGKQDGLNANQAVLVGEGILIGRIVEVMNHTAKVQLIIDKNSRINAKIIESDGKGIVEGRFGTSIIMKMIPQTVEVKKGDMVVTSKLSNYFREGLLIGYVQEVNATEDKLFQEATLTSPANFDKLHLVWILK